MRHLSELTQPQVLQIDDKAAGEVEHGEEGIPHECGGLKGRQRCGHKQRHGSAAVDHQPHQWEVQEEAVGCLVHSRQPVDGHTVNQGEHTVFRKLTKDLKYIQYAVF